MNPIAGSGRLSRAWPAVFSCICLFLWLAAGFPGSGLGAGAWTIESIPNVQLTDRNAHVSNPDGILSAGDVREINAMAGELRRRMGIEMAVVAVRGIGDNDARMFATDLFQHWGLGKKGEDSGLLIQLVTDPSQRSVVFEVGYGLEGYLPDVVCYRIQQQYMIPDLKAGNYGQAMVRGVSAVRDYFVSGEYRGIPQKLPAGQTPLEEDPFLEVLFAFAAIALLLYLARYRPGVLRAILRAIFMSGGGRGGRGGGGFGGGFGGGGGGSWGGGRSGGGGSISRF